MLVLPILREEMMENNPLKWLNSGRISSALNFLPEDVIYLESEYGMLERMCFPTWMFRTVFRENSSTFLKLRIASFFYLPLSSLHPIPNTTLDNSVFNINMRLLIEYLDQQNYRQHMCYCSSHRPLHIYLME